MSIYRRLLLVASITVCFALTSCDNSPTGPGASSGTLLEATVAGSAISFALTDGFQTYDSLQFLTRIGGAVTTGTTTRALTATFISNIATGTYPRVLGESDITITYIVSTTGGATDTYDCINHPDRCSITLTAKSGQIIDGTFSARLTNRRDTTQHIEITDGAFSVKLK